jgi:ACR3 family arsenite transporter
MKPYLTLLMAVKEEVMMRTPGRLSLLNRYLTVWILVAMVTGIGLGAAIPNLSTFLDRLSVGTTSIPIAVGLLWMMYPPLASVRYEKLSKLKDLKMMLTVSLLLNWVVGPSLMFTLAWIFLPDMPEYRIGLILVGLARCIAMVIVWNRLAEGDNDYAAVLVAVNSLFQVLFYSAMAFVFVTVLSGWVAPGGGEVVSVSVVSVAGTVAIFLGVPLLAGVLTRLYLLPRRGQAWYDGVFLRKVGPSSLVGLLFTIVVMFSLKGGYIVALPVIVLRVAIPLVAYFTIMFALTMFVSKALRLDYAASATMCFTAASNNFELAIAVAVSVFGIGSGVALATVIGPLIEVPMMIGLVDVSLFVKRKWFTVESHIREPMETKG